jgi:hypothetical protein
MPNALDCAATTASAGHGGIAAAVRGVSNDCRHRQNHVVGGDRNANEGRHEALADGVQRLQREDHERQRPDPGDHVDGTPVQIEADVTATSDGWRHEQSRERRHSTEEPRGSAQLRDLAREEHIPQHDQDGRRVEHVRQQLSQAH